MPNHHLITGATGALAPFLLHRLLHDLDVRLTCFVRRLDAPEILRGRIAALCPACAMKMEAPRVSFAYGDMRDGIPMELQADAVWHFASDLRMDSAVREDVFATNLEGTRAALDFCGRRQATLYYLSTAYVCGKRLGRILETELEAGQEFRNPYEESKARSEALVQAWLRSNPGMVFRPSIVLGETESGIAMGFGGIYKMLWALQTLRARRGLDRTSPEAGGPLKPMAIPCASKNTRVNVVAVEYVTALLARLHAAPNALGKTFHLVHPNPPTAQELMGHLCAVLDLAHVRLADPSQISEPEIEAALRCNQRSLGNQCSVYFAYLTTLHPRFDMSNVRAVLGTVPAHPRLDRLAWERMYRYAAEREFCAIG